MPCPTRIQLPYAAVPRSSGIKNHVASSASRASPLSAAQADLLSRLLQHMLDSGDAVPALKFRADNFELAPALDALESDGWLQRNQDQYIVRSSALPLLNSPVAKRLMDGIEKIYARLRACYRDTLQAPIKVDALAASTELPRDEVVAALRIMLDNSLWWSGSSTDLASPDAYVCPVERILQFSTFAEIAAEVRRQGELLASTHPSFAMLDALRDSEGAMKSPAKATGATRDIRLNNATWTILQNKRLGSPGGFAAVYLGLSEKGETVAIKVFHTTDPAMSKRELSIATQRLGRQDAHVVSILDCGVDADTDHACIVMPRAEHSLAQWLDAKGSLEEADAVAIGHAVVSGLLAARAWVHRDLKPGNILWCNGRWQIADFGIARQADAQTAQSTMKAYLSMPYAAPEQWNSEHATEKTDVYALGCMLQEVLAGQPPFAGPDQADYAQQHRSEMPKNLAGSPRMKTLLSRMLGKSPDSRPDLDELERRFKEWEKAGLSAGGQGLAAVAAKLASDQLHEQARQASAHRSQLSRGTLETDAQRELKDLGEALFDRIAHMAPNASVNVGMGSTPSMSATLGAGTLKLSIGQFRALSCDRFSESGWDVICGATIVATQHDGRGRGASLWFARRWPDSPYEWIEVAYWCIASGYHWPIEPCHLAPDHDADLAASNITHTWNFAHQPVSLIGDDAREAFIERWLARFATVASGEYRRPSPLPEN